MSRPDLLILDEPTSGLDPLMRSEFARLAREVTAEGRTVFWSSHELDEVRRLADRDSSLRTRIEVIMSASSRFTGAAAGLLRARWLVRTPVWIYRARLGILLGPRFLMLEHTGRKSGAQRYVVLEVAGHPQPGTYIVVSGFGDRAQWFRNIRANPRVRVSALSHGPAPATARILPRNEATAVLSVYSARHPRAWAAMKPILRDTLGSPAADVESRLPVIALELGRES